MVFLKELVFLGCLTFSTVNVNAHNSNLVAVVQIYRHGQRTPVKFYPNDPYQDISYWNGIDVGQLTNEGKRQLFQLGQLSRRRYGDWLSPRYDKKDIIAYSTDVDRTHMSGQANLYGLYPARGIQVWRWDSDWQPIPLHPPDRNVFDKLPATTCTKYYTEWENVLVSPYFLAIDEENADLFAFLTEQTGLNVTSFVSTVMIWDCLNIEKEVGLSLPDWSDAVYPQLTKLFGNALESRTHTLALKRLAVGSFLNQIVEYFEAMAQNPISSQKYQMYSGHDYNIAAILNAFDVYNPPYPISAGSTIYLELRIRSGEYYVNVWSSTKDDFLCLIPICVKGCTLDCPLNEFKEKLADILIDTDTFNLECVSM